MPVIGRFELGSADQGAPDPWIAVLRRKRATLIAVGASPHGSNVRAEPFEVAVRAVFFEDAERSRFDEQAGLEDGPRSRSRVRADQHQEARGSAPPARNDGARADARAPQQRAGPVAVLRCGEAVTIGANRTAQLRGALDGCRTQFEVARPSCDGGPRLGRRCPRCWLANAFQRAEHLN